MRTRFAVVTVAAMLSTFLACRSTNDIKPARPIGNKPGMVETVREVMGAEDPAQKVKVLPKPDAAEAHKAEVLKATPQPVNKNDPSKKIPTIEMLEPGPEPDLKIKTEPLPFKGSG